MYSIQRQSVANVKCVFSQLFCYEEAKNNSPLPLFLPSTFNDHNLNEFNAQNIPECWKNNNTPFLSSVVTMKHAVAKKWHFVWERHVIVGTSTPLLGTARHCWEKHATVGTSTPMLGKARHCWDQHATVGKSTPLLGTARHCWDQHATVGNSTPLLGPTHHCWDQYATDGTSTSLLGPVRHCWDQHATLGTSTPLLEPARHCWDQHANVGTSTPLLGPARHYWDQHATALLLFVQTFRCTMTQRAHGCVSLMCWERKASRYTDWRKLLKLSGSVKVSSWKKWSFDSTDAVSDTLLSNGDGSADPVLLVRLRRCTAALASDWWLKPGKANLSLWRAPDRGAWSNTGSGSFIFGRTNPALLNMRLDGTHSRSGGGLGFERNCPKHTSGQSFPEDESRNKFRTVSFTGCIEDKTMDIGF